MSGVGSFYQKTQSTYPTDVDLEKILVRTKV